MPTFITVNNITGSTPYQVYLCLSGGTECYFIDSINSTQLPYNFTVPTPVSNLSYYCLRIIDNDGCIITGCTNI